MKHIFIINTYTTKENTENIITKIKNACKTFNIDYKIELNGANDSTEKILKKYKKTKHIILAVGGDGIINRVLNEIVNTDNILGFIPYGSGNDFYKSCKAQYKSIYNKCDLIKINNKYFINTACFGIDADVANNTIKSKLFSKKQKYNISLIVNFFRFKPKPLKLTIDNEIIKDTFTTIAVCNGMYYGSGFNIAPSSKLDDNLINVYIAKKVDKLSMLDLILKLKKGKHENDQRIKKILTNTLTIESDNIINCNIDGEELEAKRFDIKLKGQVEIYFNQELINKIIVKK